MTDALATRGLSKQYGRRPALADCTLSIPAQNIVGLVGPNGAGKTTLLHLAVGMMRPTSGTIEVLGGRPAGGPAQLAKVGFVAQDAPVYAGLSVADHLRFGARMNPGWDAALARDRIDALGLDPRQRAGQLSGGQRAQLALTLALAKRPELLILDEPIASLDPATRIAVIDELTAERARRPLTLIFSSHLIGDLERLCSQLAVLSAGRIAVLEEVQWFRGLVRARLEADEGLLAGVSVPSAAMTRKSGEGRRVVLLERAVADRLRATLPTSVNITIDQPDLESAASEWMS